MMDTCPEFKPECSATTEEQCGELFEKKKCMLRKYMWVEHVICPLLYCASINRYNPTDYDPEWHH